MPDLTDHSADGGRVLSNHLLTQTPEAEPLEGRHLVLGRADAALHERDRDPFPGTVLFGTGLGLRCRGHALSFVAVSSGAGAVRPRRRAISSPLRSRRSPSIVALITLWGFVVRSDLVRMS